MSEEEKFLIYKSIIDDDFEIYDAQPAHIRYIVREYGVSVDIAEKIYREENANV